MGWSLVSLNFDTEGLTSREPGFSANFSNTFCRSSSAGDICMPSFLNWVSRELCRGTTPFSLILGPVSTGLIPASLSSHSFASSATLSSHSGAASAGRSLGAFSAANCSRSSAPRLRRMRGFWAAAPAAVAARNLGSTRLSMTSSCSPFPGVSEAPAPCDLEPSSQAASSVVISCFRSSASNSSCCWRSKLLYASMLLSLYSHASMPIILRKL
mmetsp:Transcript_55878/g.181423  ORF Transcript_55878/g.181423 Transcript_55878/m.181423 type:complete len:213 (+) Transcript_55878:108-746(+)